MDKGGCFIIPDREIYQLKNFVHLEALYRHQLRKKIILDLVGTGQNILDLGCGTGDFTIEIAAKGNEVVGVDIDKATIETASMLAGRFGISAKFIASDISQLIFPPGRFDTILLAEILEHFDDPRVLLRICIDWLKDNGCLIASVPNIRNLRNRLVFILRDIFPENQEFHKFYFTKTSLLEMLNNEGFKLEYITGDFIGFKQGAYKLRITHQFIVKNFINLSNNFIVKAKKCPRNSFRL